MISTIKSVNDHFLTVQCHNCHQLLKIPMNAMRIVTEHGAFLADGQVVKCQCGHMHYPYLPFVTTSKHTGETQVIGCPKCGTTMAESRRNQFKYRRQKDLFAYDLIFACPNCQYSFVLHNIPERDFECNDLLEQ